MRNYPRNNTQKKFWKKWWFWVLILSVYVISLYIAPIPSLIAAILIGAVVVFLISFSIAYFHSERFFSIKNNIKHYIDDCNELNYHIEELRSSYLNFKRLDYGEAEFHNISRYNYKRGRIAEAKYAPNVYDCSKTICDSARKQPFKYVCKYFNIREDETSLEAFEEILNNFLAAEDGKKLLADYRQDILDSIAYDVPRIIRKLFPEKLERELGFDQFVFNEFYYPVFSFRYISAGGNAGTRFDVIMDIPMLERFINYLSARVQFRKSAAGQRQLMTPKFRQYIISRDNYTCQNCGNSVEYEPNLLLEVDHIIPISKGGLTTEDNLQTLCWKCNRHKGSKIYNTEFQL